MSDTHVTTPPASSTPPVTPPVAPPADVQQAATRPEWLPEAHWDGTAKTIKLDDFGKHYSEIATAHKTHAEQQAALAARKPEDIKIEVKLPDTVKVPEGLQVKIDEKDPRVPILRDIAVKNNLSQEAVDAIVAFDAQQQIEAHVAETTRIKAEDAKLGANADQRKQAVGNWLKGLKDNNTFTAEEYQAVRIYVDEAAAVTALEKIIAKANGSVPGAGGNPPNQQQTATVEQRWYGQKG
jgi:hypothetical protein